MTLPRIQILALGGTIATAPDASGAVPAPLLAFCAGFGKKVQATCLMVEHHGPAATDQ